MNTPSQGGGQRVQLRIRRCRIRLPTEESYQSGMSLSHSPDAALMPLGETPQGKVAAVVPAAGSSERMGGGTPKQYIEVCGRPLVTYCLEALQKVDWVLRVVVVADDVARMREVVQDAALSKVMVIQGGGSRHRSIRTGVEALAKEKDPPDIVVVHDGARPLIPVHTLTQVAMMAERHGAAGAVRNLVSTVVMPDAEDFLQESLVRSLYRNSEMPQAFRLEVLRDAYRRCSDEEADHGTECLALVLQHCGVKAKLVPGTPQLWKVTEEKDLEVARVLVPRLTRTTVLVCRTLAFSQPSHTAGVTHTSHPFTNTLTCNENCLHLFASLESTLIRYCKKLHFSPTYKISFPLPISLVAIINSNQESLLEHLKAAAIDIIKAASPVIFIVNQQTYNPNITALNISSLQKGIRKAFISHLGPVTVILRRNASENITEGVCHSEGQVDGSSLAQLPSDTDHLCSLVASLLNNNSHGFHGLVLVV